MKKATLITNKTFFESKGQYFYKLNDPFRNIHYVPLGADTIANNLDIVNQRAKLATPLG